MPNSNCSFRLATDDDIKQVHDWLVDHHRREIHGSFLCNWNLTQREHDKGNVIVGVYENVPVAYMWADFGIVEVREDYRRKGIGRNLVEYALDRARSSDNYCINIECAPETSIPFWQHMDFKLYNRNHAYLIIEKSLPLPKVGEPVDIEISFYPESKKWEPETTALKVFSPPASKTSNGTIYLGNRVAIFGDGSIWHNDPVLGIRISGSEIYIDKAKYQKATDLGVQSNNGAYAIERINA
jgi:GNAT superfamily N-acetyltransferase